MLMLVERTRGRILFIQLLKVLSREWHFRQQQCLWRVPQVQFYETRAQNKILINKDELSQPTVSRNHTQQNQNHTQFRYWNHEKQYEINLYNKIKEIKEEIHNKKWQRLSELPCWIDKEPAEFLEMKDTIIKSESMAQSHWSLEM